MSQRRLWRVGRSLGRTLYWQVGAEPSKDDVFVGIMDTVGLAAQVVAACNGATRLEVIASCIASTREMTLADLRAKVEALPSMFADDESGGLVILSDVLALIAGSGE